MRTPRWLLGSLLALSTVGFFGCDSDTGETDSVSDDITNPSQGDVRRQAIGNCWLYAAASWAEGMHVSATEETQQLSQSYWTFWHWFDEVQNGWGDEIQTGGSTWVSNQIINERGLMLEADFVKEDAVAEMSSRQASALEKMNREVKAGGRLDSYESKQDKKLVLDILIEAWQLDEDVAAAIRSTFGEDGSRTFDGGDADAEGTLITAPSAYQVAYPERVTDPEVATWKTTTLDVAISEHRTRSYPTGADDRRAFQIRMQRILHDGASPVVTWNVDFNAMESSDPERMGSFNLQTLEDAGGPGREGGHMTVLHDYQVVTEEFGLLQAGVTLDPENADDAAKLAAALLPSSEVQFFRIKNSWGKLRSDRGSAPGMPGYHDLYVDYMNGPIRWCPSVEGTKTEENCRGTTVPFREVLMPPGY